MLYSSKAENKRQLTTLLNTRESSSKCMGKHLLTAEVFDRHGRSLSRAVNNYHLTHPVQAKFAKQANQPDRIYLHAEIAALVKLRKGQKPYKIAIKRFRKDGTTALAAPCPVCVAAIKHWGIQNVEYTL